MNEAELIAALRDRGIIAADAPPRPEHDERPWFISLLLGVAGWAAGLFALAFLFTFFDLATFKPLLPIGGVLLAVAFALYVISHRLVFLEQLALALSIAGQVALAIYFGDELREELPLTAALLGLQLLVFIVMPDRTAKILSSFFACIAWVFVLRFWLRPHEGQARFTDAQGNPIAPLFGAWTLPIEWLLTWGPPILLLIWLRRTETRWMARRAAFFARPAITGLLLALAIGGICAEPESMLVLDDGATGRVFNAWALLPLTSIALAMVAAYFAFTVRNAALTGVAIVAALVHLSRFYYLYGTTLTLKAMIMLAVGLVLLGAGRLLGRHLGEPA